MRFSLLIIDNDFDWLFVECESYIRKGMLNPCMSPKLSLSTFWYPFSP